CAQLRPPQHAAVGVLRSPRRCGEPLKGELSMRRLAYTLSLIAAASLVAVGCSDVGDSSAVGGDAQSPLEDASEDVTVQGSGEDGGPDSTIPVVDSGVDSTVPPNDEDSGAGDSAP